jgi:hypothetical protein
MGLKALRSLDIFVLLVLTKSIFVVFMCVYNMGKALVNVHGFTFWFVCLCVCVFFVCKSLALQWSQVQIPNQCLCMWIVWGLGQRFFKFAWVCVHLGGWEFVLCIWHDVNLLHETTTMANWWSIHNQLTPPLKF